MYTFHSSNFRTEFNSYKLLIQSLSIPILSCEDTSYYLPTYAAIVYISLFFLLNIHIVLFSAKQVGGSTYGYRCFRNFVIRIK